jgi:hypothetical protein
LGQPALDHDAGGAQELAEERFLPNHIIILGNPDSSVKKKSTLGHGIYSRKCENRGSERCILRRKVAKLGTLLKAWGRAQSGQVFCSARSDPASSRMSPSVVGVPPTPFGITEQSRKRSFCDWRQQE